MAGIKDIAASCGVSPATVSRVLNGDPMLSVTPAVRRAVEEEAARIGYKTPRQRRHDMLRVILMLSPVDKPGFEEQLLQYLAPLARKNGMVLSLSPYDEKADGLIALGEFSSEEIGYFQHIAENLLLVNNLGSDYAYDSIMIDYSNAERQVLDHFLALDIDRIGYIGGLFRRGGSLIGRRRAAEFRALLEEKGLYREEWFRMGTMDEEHGYSAVMAMDEIPDGLFISDPDTERGVQRALSERSSDAETVVYTNFFIPECTGCTPLLIFSDDVWHTAFRMLGEKVKGEREQSISVFCPARLSENTASLKRGEEK